MVNRTLNLYFRNVYPAKWTRKTGFYFYSRQQQAVSGGQWRFSGLHQFDQWLMDWEETSVPGCSQLVSIFSLLLSAYGTHEASSSFQGLSKFPNVCAASKPQTDRRRRFPLGVTTCLLPCVEALLVRADRWNAAKMSGNGNSAVGLMSYETLVHAVAGAVVSKTQMSHVSHVSAMRRICICVACLIWYVLSFLILVTLFSVKMIINNACFLRGAPQPWPSSSLWTQPKADCRVSIGSYHVGQRLPDSGYNSWVVWTHYNHYGWSPFSFRHKLDADIALFLSRDVVKITNTWTKMLVTFFTCC